MISVAACALLLAACAPAPNEAGQAATQAADTAALDGLRASYVAAETAGDAAALGALWTDDGVLMPPYMAAVQGSAAIQSYYQGMFDQNTIEASASGEETVIAGDWSFGRGNFSISITPKAGGDAMHDSGKYIVVARRQADNSWKVARLIFNSNMPPPGAPAPGGAGR
jgi:ketosteroid isomerase-like protein